MPDLGDMLGEAGNPQAGLAEYHYMCPVDDIETFGEPVASPTTLAASKTITTAHVCKTGKKFIKAKSVRNKGNANFTTVGALGMLGIEGKPVLFVKGDSAEMRGWVEKVMPLGFLLMLIDRDGLTSQYGTKDIPCYIEKVEYKSGDKAGDDKGYMFTFSHEGLIPFVYDAQIPTTPAA